VFIIADFSPVAVLHLRLLPRVLSCHELKQHQPNAGNAMVLDFSVSRMVSQHKPLPFINHSLRYSVTATEDTETLRIHKGLNLGA
jgi:hypothetical protein